MSAKSFGIFPVIYAVGTLQNTLPHTTILLDGDRNTTGGSNGVVSTSEGLRLSIQHCMKGKGGSQLLFLLRKWDGGGKLLTLYGCSKDFWQTL